MTGEHIEAPENTAERVALWRAMHVQVDQPGPQAWKYKRHNELGYGIPDRLHLVPVDFEAIASWREKVSDAGFAGLASGSTLAMTFMLPIELIDDSDRLGSRAALKGAKASGTPFVSFYAPSEMVALAREADLTDSLHIAGTSLAGRYSSSRTDVPRPSSGEDILLATIQPKRLAATVRPTSDPHPK